MKAFPTHLTHEWFVTRVDPEMCVESGAPIERLTAVPAFVWLFVGVCDNIFLLNQKKYVLEICSVRDGIQARKLTDDFVAT